MPPNNTLAVWGNEKTMNLNNLILTNIQSSPYFKINLFNLKTYHEVIDEIYYKVQHLEPWEKGSRKTAGQTGMCGGVRGVGAGGIVSSAYCLLYKLYTLKLTRKQLVGLLTHTDSPYIRGLGFMYIRYTQPPADLWDWYEPYFDDDEEVDVKAGGGHVMLIGEMIRQWLVKLEWYATLFPRIPVPIQKDIDVKIKQRFSITPRAEQRQEPEHIPDNKLSFGEAERIAKRRSPDYGRKDGGHSRSPRCSPSRRRSPRPSPPRRSPPRRSPPRRSPPRRSPPRHHSPCYKHRKQSRHSPDHNGDDFMRELEREKRRQIREREKRGKRSRSHSSRDHKRSRSRDRKDRKHRSHSRDKKSLKSKHEDRDAGKHNLDNCGSSSHRSSKHRDGAHS
ncbi:hypothetical protein SNE40_021243 [Patella caerulea]|uniref:Pre-mRNA-splicing factor 38 n=1 Tax=Patella caerulea TaxID=87958 RepID=A0AAN8G3Z0_PATCE